jgi:UDP-glucose:glycoprotein glucosyltransferase
MLLLVAAFKLDLLSPKEWKKAPFILHLVEFMKQEPIGHFGILERLANLTSMSSKQVYSLIDDAEWMADYIPLDISKSLAKAALSNHAMAPAIQAHYHLYSETIIPSFNKFDHNCAVWIDAGSQLCLDTNSNIPLQVSPQHSEILQIDRVLGTNSTASLVIAYADVLDGSFPQVYSNLFKLAQSNLIRLVLRYIPSKNSDSSESFQLSGYGAELAIKNTDYKVTDDQEIQTDEAKQGSEDYDLKPENINESQYIKHLTKKEIAHISPKMIGFALQSSNPLEQLALISQNFPKYAAELAKLPKPNPALVHESQKVLKSVESENLIMINGAPINADNFNLFEYALLTKIIGSNESRSKSNRVLPAIRSQL